MCRAGTIDVVLQYNKIPIDATITVKTGLLPYLAIFGGMVVATALGTGLYLLPTYRLLHKLSLAFRSIVMERRLGRKAVVQVKVLDLILRIHFNQLLGSLFDTFPSDARQ